MLTEQNLPFATRALLYYSLHMPDHRGKWRVISLLKHLTPPLEQTQIVVKREHLKWSIDPTDYVQSQLFWYGSRDKWEIYHLRRLLNPGAVILDVGANFGYYSLVLTHFLQRNCTVYAFEPNPRSYQNLSRNILLNKMENMIRPQCFGLSDCDGEASFIEPKGNTGASTLVPGHGVEVITLDSFARTNNLTKIDLIKIDVEGMERSVLKGARYLIESGPVSMVLLIEVHPHTLRRAGTSCYDLIQDIQDFGFKIYEIRRNILKPFQAVPAGDDYINVLCQRATGR